MEKNTEEMRTLERIWIVLVVLTFLSVIPCRFMFPDKPYSGILVISLFIEVFLTVLYSLLFKTKHNKDRS